MGLIVSFVIYIVFSNLHYLGCINMLNIAANKNISDEVTVQYMDTYIDKFGCDASISINLSETSSKRLDLLIGAYISNKPKTLDYILSKKPTISKELTNEITSDFIIFLTKNGVSAFDNKPNSEKSLEFLKTDQYKEFKSKNLDLIKKLVDSGVKPELFEYLLKTLEYIKDDAELKNLLGHGNR